MTPPILPINENAAATLDEVVERMIALETALPVVTGLLGFLDRALGRLDDIVASFSVLRAREAAWAHAKTLWQVRDQRELTGAYLDALEHTVGLAGRGLLQPTLLGLGGWASRRPELPVQFRTALGAPKPGI